MDNFRIDVTSQGERHLAAVFDIVAKYKIIGYSVEDGVLIFYWSEHPAMTKLPFTLDAKGAVDFVTRWLAEQDYGDEPDHDGSNGKGWRAYNEAWGHVKNRWQALVAIHPVWAMYGK